MCLKLNLDLTNETEEEKKEWEWLEKDVNKLLAADPDARWEMTSSKLDSSKNL